MKTAGEKEYRSSKEIRKHLWQGKRYREVLCFGDSNTFGLVPGTGERYDYEIRWTGRLQELLAEEGSHVTEEGLCGRTTIFDDKARAGRRGTELLPVLLEAHKDTELLIIMLGTNDCKTEYHADAATIASGMEELVLQARRICPDAEILLVSPIYLGNGVGEPGFDTEFDRNSEWVSRQLAREYRKVAERQGCHFMAASDYAEASETDREHMNENGHRLLAEAVYHKIEEIAGRPAGPLSREA